MRQNAGVEVRGVTTWVTVVWSVALVVLAINTAVSSYNVNVLIFNEEQVTRTRLVQQELSEVLSAIKDAETGHRGFQITSKPDYLKPYHDGTRLVHQRLSELEGLIADNPAQLPDAVLLRNLVTQKLAMMQRALDIHLTVGREAAHAEIRKDVGLEIMNEVRAVVARMNEREEKLLQNRARIASNKYRATTITNLLGGALGLGMLVLGYGLVRWELRRRQMTEAALRLREEELARSEAQFRTLVQAIPQIVWVADSRGEDEYFNSKWYDYTGLNAQQSMGSGWSAALHPEDRARTLKRWQLSLDSGVEYQIEYRLLGADGRYRWFQGRALPQRDDHGRIIRWFGTCTDIHDAKLAADAARQAAHRFRTLTETMPQLVLTTDPMGKVTYLNHRWREFTGLPVLEKPSGSWGDAIHPDDAEQVRAEWQLAMARQPDVFTEEFRLKCARDGKYRWMQSSAIPLRDAGGIVTDWVCTITDIDDQKQQAENLERMVQERTAELLDEVEERKAVEQEVRNVAAELARSNGELEQFAYIASHDLQEPLRKIQAFGDRLKNKYREQLPDMGQEYVDRMLISAGRMRRLIDDLLSFSRVTTQAREFVRVDLGKLVPEVVSDLDNRIEEVGAELRIGEMPVLAADPSQMRQLFQNLIANGLKFHKAGVAPVIDITAERVSEALPESGDQPVSAWKIRVRDNGIGFEEKYVGRIFQVFQRLHGRDEYEGTGVGLAICRKIVERHGGTLTAQSRPGEGATFIVTLPMRDPESLMNSSDEGPH